MTRINLIPVEELADQHLMAEYREIPRMGSFAHKTVQKAENIPDTYRLGKGHMIFFLNKATYLEERHKEVVAELKRRGFKLTQYEPFEMPRKFPQLDDWQPVESEIEESRERIEEKLAMKPQFYRWTKREE